MPTDLQKQPAIVSLGAGPNQLPFIKKARETGFSVIAVDRNSEAPGFDYADVNLALSTHDSEAVISALKTVSTDYLIKGIVARTTGQALYTASAVVKNCPERS